MPVDRHHRTDRLRSYFIDRRIRVASRPRTCSLRPGCRGNATDENKLPRARLREGGKLEVEGDKHAFIQGMIRSFAIEVRDVTYHRYYEVSREGLIERAHQGYGRHRERRLDRGRPPSRIAHEVGTVYSAAGRQREAPLDRQHRLSADWEIGHDAQFYIECYVPKAAFDDLERAYSSGRVTVLTPLLDTTLWVHDFDWHTPPSGDVAWYMVPEVERQSDSPPHETGRITQLGWQEVPPLRSKPPRPPGETPKEDHPELGQHFADATIRAAMDESGPPPVPQKKKSSWASRSPGPSASSSRSYS
jgi:hypothetical protein